MKKFATVCALAALSLLGTVPAAAATTNTSHPQPISGTTSGPDAYASPATCPEGATWRFIGTGTGRLTHLGKVTATNTHCTFLSDASFSGGEMTITAANGDELFMEYSGTFELMTDEYGNPVRSDVELDWVIVGGSGRFAGATGSGEGIGFSLISGPTTSATTMNYEGMISTAVGSARSN
jgi:hypothetical protein